MRGQVGTETLMVIGLAVVLIMAVIYTVLPMMFDFTQYSENSRIETSLFKLKSTVESVSSYGPGTSTDLMLYFPEGTIRKSERMLIFEKTNEDTILVQMDVPFEIKDNKDKNVISGINKFKVTKPERVDDPVLIE